MKRILEGIRLFFFPPTGAKLGRRLLPYIVLGILTLSFLVGSVYAWDYTNSPGFCGTTCHTMPPEFTAYQVSPHARVACVDCHIGRGFVGTQITRKAGDLKHVYYTLTRKYEFPITADEMRPARETCEKCHFPEKFSDDSLKEIQHYANDLYNTPTTTFLVLKTGGGSKRVGMGKGIHWHIENKVMYYPTDKSEQSIPYVKVFDDDGGVQEYVDVASGFDPSTVKDSDLREMDCITCHNRITHLVLTPEASMDTALERHIIDPAIPEIRGKGVEVLRGTYLTQEEALNSIAALEEYYRITYRDFYRDNQRTVQAAIAAIQDIYSRSVYLEQKSDWNSHPNNIGHKDTPGCFRCHDGKHLNAKQEAIRLECNLCHSIPVVATRQDFLTQIEISRGPEPQSHFNPNWINIHHNAFDNTCNACHTTGNAGGTDNTSFCSNSACHGNAWEYAGFDAPALREILIAQLPPTPMPSPTSSPTAEATPAAGAPSPTPSASSPSATPQTTGGALTYNDTIGPLFQNRCGSCHGQAKIQGLDLTTYATAMAGSTQGAVIVPGDPGASLLIQTQSETQAHFGQLTPEELDLVLRWIQAGAPEK